MAAAEVSLLDVTARAYGIPVYEMLGGLKRPALPVSWVAFIRDGEGIEEEIREKADLGFRAFKLKVGADHASDLEQLKTVKGIYGPRCARSCRCERGVGREEVIAKLNEMHTQNVDAVETPVKAAARSIAKNSPGQVNENVDDVAADLARARASVPVRVIEHVSDSDDAFARALAQHDAVDCFNVIPGQAGGVYRAQRLIQLAEISGTDVLLGSTVELSPGTAIALHLGLSSRVVPEACDLVGPDLLIDDVCEEPLHYTNGNLCARPASDLGVSLDPRKQEALSI